VKQQPAYLLAAQTSELERLQLQSRVWEPAGDAFVQRLTLPPSASAIDVGCGVLGWLRVLSRAVGPMGRVMGTDIDPRMLEHARAFVDAEQLANIALARDDLFASTLPGAAFDLVHARFQLAPLGRFDEQLAAYRRLLKADGWLVLEDPEIGSWRVQAGATRTQELIALIERGFAAAGGDFNAGRRLPTLLRALGGEPFVAAHVIALEPAHPYLRLPLQFATALRPRLERLVGPDAFAGLLADVEVELARPGTWGTTFTLVQAAARLGR
jgi:SAM-dependent methyltransferase